MDPFLSRGWVRFDADPDIARWAAAARAPAEAAFADPYLRAKWLRCGGTWFAGVNVFANDADGAMAEQGVPALSGAPIAFIAGRLGLADFAWDQAQISICMPGYPQPWSGESEAAFRFRRDRDAAHLDGLLRDAERRRRPGEQHGFVLGIPLTEAHPAAAPLVVYEGSHEIMRRALAERLRGIPAEHWAEEDVTEVYTAARREAFEVCRRVPVHAKPGEAYLVHRLALHGVAPWRAPAEGMRMIAYFRPDPFPGAGPGWWLERP